MNGPFGLVLIGAAVGAFLACRTARARQREQWLPFVQLSSEDQRLVRRAIWRRERLVDPGLSGVLVQYASGTVDGACRWQRYLAWGIVASIASGVPVAMARGDDTVVVVRLILLAVFVPLVVFTELWRRRAKQALAKNRQ